MRASGKDDGLQYTLGHVTSKDGTTLGFRQLGVGPAVILLHGGMQASQNLMQLAQSLSTAFTLYVPDRRGRGLSGPHGSNYGLDREVEDLDALVLRSGATQVFALSSGALVALRAALLSPAIRQLAVYEPPFPLSGATSLTGWVERYAAEVARGDLAAAMVSVIRGTADPNLMSVLPRFLFEPMLRFALPKQARRVQPPDVALAALIPTLHYDVQLIPAFEGKLQDYQRLQTDVLLLGGSQSRDYLRAAVDALERVLPRVRRVELAGLGHLAADNTGRPERVAAALRGFFAPSSVPLNRVEIPRR